MTAEPGTQSGQGAAGRSLPGGYRFRIGLALLVIGWERLWRALWPVLVLAAVFAALALLGLPPLLPGFLHAALIAGFACGFAVLLWYGAASLVLPRRAEARRRIELGSGLAHRPLQALDDRLAEGVGSDEARRLWQAHRARMRALAKRLRVGFPEPGLAARDPLALRFAAALLMFVALSGGWSEAPQRLRAALSPDLLPASTAPPPVLQLWITPPAYTGLAPIFPSRIASARPEAADLPAEDGTEDASVIRVPAGSGLTGRLSGGSGQASLVLGEETLPFEPVDARNAAIEAPIGASGRLAVLQGERVLAEWRVALIPDRPPEIGFTDPPAATRRQALSISFAAADDYGIEEVGAEIRRSYERGAVIGKEVEALDLILPDAGPRSAKETSYHDLTPHRWAGLPVVVRLWAADALGQTSFSEDAGLVLPERDFRHPVARAVIAERRRLVNEPVPRRSIADALAGIAARPWEFGHDITAFLALSSAHARLRHDGSGDAFGSVGDLLWETALGIEEGRLSLVERELRRARRALAEALARGAPDQELDRLMDELQRAVERFARELAERLRRRPDSTRDMQFDPRMGLLEATDLRQMMEQMRDLLRAGARDAAREMLARLQNLLENLRAGRPMPMNPQMQAGSQALSDLQKLIRQQTELMNRSFGQSRSGRGPQPGESRSGAATQRALREALERLREALRRAGMLDPRGGAEQAMDGAGRNMGDSARALDRNAPGDSVGPQGRAIEALQRAGSGIVRQMMERVGRDNGMGLGQQFVPAQHRRDPFGRFSPDRGGADTRDLTIPDAGAVRRSQRILEELRHRSGQRQRPSYELDYIERLLRRF